MFEHELRATRTEPQLLSFEAVPTIRDTDSGLELVGIVNLPETTFLKVVRRLRE